MANEKLLVHNPARTHGYNRSRPSKESETCLFCDQENVKKYLIAESTGWIVRANAYPFIDGAVLIIPKRHIEFVHQTTSEEWLELKEHMDYLGTRQAHRQDKDDG